MVKKMSYFPGYINLLKTSIGSGILAYPYLFLTYGIVPTIIISSIAAMFSFSGLMLYIESSKFLLRNKESVNLASLTTKCYPKSKTVADIAIILKCFGVGTSYLIIVRQLLPVVLIDIFGEKIISKPPIALFIFLIITSPLSYFKRIDKLKYTSFCGIICILIMVVSTFYRAYETEKFEMKYVSLSTPLSLLWVAGIGKFVFSFTCHQNIFSVQNEVISSSHDRGSGMVKMAFSVVSTAFVAYIIFGILNYFIYGNKIENNILESFPNDRLSLIIRALYVIVMGFSYPLQINPCRLHFIELLNSNHRNINYENTEENIITTNRDADATIVVYIITSCLLLLTYLIAISGVDLGSVYSIVGATAGSLMCYILPGFIYLKLDIPEKKVKICVISGVSIIFGILISTFTLLALIFS